MHELVRHIVKATLTSENIATLSASSAAMENLSEALTAGREAQTDEDSFLPRVLFPRTGHTSSSNFSLTRNRDMLQVIRSH